MWRSEDEMLEVVQRRAAAARDRRRALLTGSTAVVLLVAALGVAALRGPSDDPQQVRVASPAPTTTLFVPPALTDSPPISITPLPITSATTTVPRTTTVRPATTTRPPSTPTTRALAATCTPEEVQAGFAPSKATFATGEPIRLSVTLRNTSGRECGYSSDGQLFTVRDAAGSSVGADWGASSHVDCLEGIDVCGYTWAAGAEQAFPVCWDQRRAVDGASTQAAPGRYTIGFTVSGRVTSPVSATMTVEIAPPPAGTTPPSATC